MRKIFFIGLFLTLFTKAARAEVVRLEIKQRLDFAEGRSFKGIGKYQRLLGRVHFSVDPRHAANRTVVDLDLAPVNAKGRVEYRADFEILAPVDLAKANGALVYGVNNRGNRRLLDYFNVGADHWLMRHPGYQCVIWTPDRDRWGGGVSEPLIQTVFSSISVRNQSASSQSPKTLSTLLKQNP